MKPKTRRLWWVLLALCCMAVGISIILSVFRDNLVFFFSPTELAVNAPSPERKIRVGGLIKQGSMIKEGSQLSFVLTDMENDIQVIYEGVVPPMFREGQGIVAEGNIDPASPVLFHAETLLTKHDENYMPPEVADSLKKTGHWKEGDAP